MMELPQAFTARMKRLLDPEEYADFIESYEKEAGTVSTRRQNSAALAGKSFHLEIPGQRRGIITPKAKGRESILTTKRVSIISKSQAPWQ